MSGDVQLELWLNEYKMKALSSVLEKEGASVETAMQEYLNRLYEIHVPLNQQQEIQVRIDAERAEEQAAQEAAQVFTALHVREHGQEEYFRLDHGMELLYAARTLRRYLRLEPGADADSFAELFRNRKPITAQEFDELVCLRMDNTGKVAGAFELDFDKLEFSAVHIMDGWKTFTMGDVSTAAFHAFQKARLSEEQRLEKLLDKLNGREITSAGHLSASEVSFAGEISEIDGLLNFCLETGFDVDAVFGTRVCTSENDDTLNVYANYDMAAGQVCNELEVDLHRADGREEMVEYRLNAAEKSVLLQKMDIYCQAQTGQSLKDYSAQLMAEDMTPPAGPVM